ncbi:MAG: phosphatidic acid phosphatase [Treponema sp.]|nr:MAG: phosphatidic acid phosphatase [Treponema sp.]
MYFYQLRSLFSNGVFLATFTSWFVSQLLKAIIAIIKAPRKKIGIFFKVFGNTGGMPSSHSAVVVCLAATIGIKHGWSSDYFVLALFLATIVIRDAVGVRRSSGLQAQTLNNLGNKVSKSLDIEFKSVKEINGHKPVEVFVGGLIGLVLAYCFPV